MNHTTTPPGLSCRFGRWSIHVACRFLFWYHTSLALPRCLGMVSTLKPVCWTDRSRIANSPFFTAASILARMLPLPAAPRTLNAPGGSIEIFLVFPPISCDRPIRALSKRRSHADCHSPLLPELEAYGSYAHPRFRTVHHHERVHLILLFNMYIVTTVSGRSKRAGVCGS